MGGALYTGAPVKGSQGKKGVRLNAAAEPEGTIESIIRIESSKSKSEKNSPMASSGPHGRRG